MLAIATFNVRNRGHQIRPLRNGLGLRMTDHSHSLNNQSEPLFISGSLWTIFRISTILSAHFCYPLVELTKIFCEFVQGLAHPSNRTLTRAIPFSYFTSAIRPHTSDIFQSYFVRKVTNFISHQPSDLIHPTSSSHISLE
jgi:hypothetical protein